MIGFLGALPKAGSFFTGPEPAAPKGTWPAYKGKPGPKQQKCLSLGGRWIGPTGRKWCQVPTPVLPAMPPPDLTVLPPIAPMPGVPGSIVPPYVVGGPVDNSQIPAGEDGGGGGPVFGPPPGADIDDFVVGDFIQEGPVAASATAAGGQRSLDTTSVLLMAAAAGGLIWMLARKSKTGSRVRAKRR